MKNPQEAWAAYRKNMMHPMANFTQILEAKRAFVAGMMIGHEMTCKICEMENDDEAVSALESLLEQLCSMGSDLG